MGFEIKNKEQLYFIVTNYQELADRAREMGYENIYLIEGTRLPQRDTTAMRKSGTCAVLMIYDHDGAYEKIERQLEDREIKVNRICFMDEDGACMGGNDKDIPSLAKAVAWVMPKKELENHLDQFGYLPHTDYTGRCGTCHRMLDPEDNFCMHCGTKRGKGRFEPYYNVTNYVYGPQVKMKFKCMSCGHLWITAQLGGDRSKYCPKCGKSRLSELRFQVAENMFGLFGCLEPFDEDNRPVLFTDEEIDHFLHKRGKTEDSLWAEGILKLMYEDGYDYPKDYDELWERPLTEAEGEKLTMVERMLSLTGEEYVDDYHCPCCGSDRLALFKYKRWELKDASIQTPTHLENPLVKDGYSVSEADLRHGVVPALLCLKCGKEFGDINHPEDL